jgi:ferredoxin-NADP reductase
MTSHESRIAARLESKIEIVEGLAIFRFTLAEDFRFKPGQYATLWLTHRGKTLPRPYSIASSPSEFRVLEFYINLVAEGKLTPSLWDPEVLHALAHRYPETELAVTGPRGRFVLDLDDPRDFVFVASGTGLAPFMSMIRKLNEDYQTDPEGFQARRIYVVHGVSLSSHFGYHKELERIAADTLRDPPRAAIESEGYYPEKPEPQPAISDADQAAARADRPLCLLPFVNSFLPDKPGRTQMRSSERPAFLSGDVKGDSSFVCFL